VTARLENAGGYVVVVSSVLETLSRTARTTRPRAPQDHPARAPSAQFIAAAGAPRGKRALVSPASPRAETSSVVEQTFGSLARLAACQAEDGPRPGGRVKRESDSSATVQKRYEEVGLRVDHDATLGWSPTTLPEQTAARYAAVITELARALTAHREGERPAPGTTTRSNNLTPCVCACGRRIRIAPSVLDQGPITYRGKLVACATAPAASSAASSTAARPATRNHVRAVHVRLRRRRAPRRASGPYTDQRARVRARRADPRGAARAAVPGPATNVDRARDPAVGAHRRRAGSWGGTQRTGPSPNSRRIGLVIAARTGLLEASSTRSSPRVQIVLSTAAGSDWTAGRIADVAGGGAAGACTDAVEGRAEVVVEMFSDKRTDRLLKTGRCCDWCHPSSTRALRGVCRRASLEQRAFGAGVQAGGVLGARVVSGRISSLTKARSTSTG
jgi:hypothetical protein